ncbi:peptidoglycan editing factor PgeF [Dyella sp.]|jgi:YfiH family protein|uniref:peptidoglycan editing factor PgeF n=1 Tax=Dyella sp. TaxID=1869338 RepID=UPI002D7980BA|nr:peptidoglycan editing factor PgeF [Dyella sp.]HET6433326.1 peptidoglycan editing factor PgeF [Dyella sp.]
MSEGGYAPEWVAAPGVRAAVSTRQMDGVSQPPYAQFNLGLRSGEAPDAVRENRRRLAGLLALPNEPVWLQQVHGTDVAVIANRLPPAEPVADAAVTRELDRPLAILTADCLPLLLCSDDGAVVGAAHAGWRGLAAGVIERTVASMEVEPARVRVWLGPCIGQPSYEVGEEVRNAFVDADSGAAACFLATRAGHWRCDLAALARRRLRALGVTALAGGGFDTFTDARFYSYRRDGAASGRFVSLIWRSGTAT